MAKITPTSTSVPFELWDANFDTGWTTESNTLTAAIGGVTPILDALTMNQASGFVWNVGKADLDVTFHGTVFDNLLRVDAGNNGVVLNGTSPTWTRAGTTISSTYLAIKPDIANANSAGVAIFSSSTLRAADFSYLKAGGTEAAPTALVNGDIVNNTRWEGYVGGAAGFEVGATLTVTVDDAAVGAGRCDMSVNWQNTSAGVTKSFMCARANGNVGYGNNTSPLSSMDNRGSMGWSRRATATNYTTDNDIFVDVTSTAAPRTMTIGASDIVGRRVLIFKDSSGNAGVNNITITPASGNIDNSASYVINTNYGAVMMECDGVNWKVLASFTPQGTTSYVDRSGTYTIAATDDTVNCSANTFTVTLPTAGGRRGKVFTIKNSGTGLITLATTGSQTIDGATTHTLIQYASIVVQSIGPNWIILSRI